MATKNTAAKTAEKQAPETKKEDRPELNWKGTKYEKAITEKRGGNAFVIPEFKEENTVVELGPNAPKRDNSVMARMRGLVKDAGGSMTGRELVEAMMKRKDWDETGAKVKYARHSGQVCADWCIGYVKGAMRPTNGYLQASKKQPKATEAKAEEPTQEKATA